MDPLDKISVWEPNPGNAEAVRRNLGCARRFAERMNLTAVKPHPELASSGYCLANPGSEYLVYQPQPSEPVTVELKAGTYLHEWFNPATGLSAGTTVRILPVEGQLFRKTALFKLQLRFRK